MALKFSNIITDVPNKNKTIKKKYLRLVNGVSGEFHYGELTAIMGPSGSGKSTFLGSISSRLQKGSKFYGDLTLDDKELDYRQVLKRIGILVQNDDFFPNLTLYETFRYAVDFKIKKTHIGDKNEYIQKMLKNLV